MDQRSLAPQRPIRAAAIAAAAIALWGSFWCLVGEVAPGRCMLFMACYGILLGGGVIGVFLASDYRVTRWWMACFLIVFTLMAILSIVIICVPESLLEWIWLFRITYVVAFAWLLAGCLLAVFGWWTHFRRPKFATVSGPVDDVSSRS